MFKLSTSATTCTKPMLYAVFLSNHNFKILNNKNKMENNCNYSDEWQPYINDYDKFEYDVKLKDGTIVENCYPNGGKFNSISDLHDGLCFEDTEVLEIRFSEKPRYGINGEVSKYPQYEYLDNSESETNENMAKKSNFKNSKMFSILAGYSAMSGDMNFGLPKYKSHRGIRIDVRTEPKIGRNSICPKCESGLKFKRCCGVGK